MKLEGFGPPYLERKKRMNIADKMKIESRLMRNLADWMTAHGTVLFDRQQSNAYTGVRIREIAWRGREYRVVDVDGMTCGLERIK